MDSDVSHVSPNQIQSVRVVKGPYALTWGAGALSALQLETFRPDFAGETFRANGRLALNYGANGDVGDAVASVWGSSDRFRFALLHNTRAGNDYKDGGGNRVAGDYQSYDTRWDFGWRANRATLIEYSGGYQEQRDIDYPGRILDATFFKTQSHAMEVTWTPAGANLSEVYAQLFINAKEHLMNNDEKPTARPMAGRMPPFGIQVELPALSDTYGGRFGMSFARGDWSWKLGLDFYSLDQSAERSISRRDNGGLVFQDIVWPDAGIKDLGSYGQLVYEMGRAQIGGTLRVDRVTASAGESSDYFAVNTTGAMNQDETNLSAALSGTVQMTDDWTLTAGVGRAVRTATTLERYSDRFPATKFQVAAEFLGNPMLEPEKSLEWNLGSAIQIANTLIEGDFYYRIIDDYITVVPDPSLNKRLPLSPDRVFRYINGTEARFTGFELRAQQALGAHLDGFGWLAYVWAEDELLDEPVFGIPPLEGRVGVQFHTTDRSRWVELGVSGAADQDRVASTRLEVPTEGWTVFDVRAGLAFRSDWIVRVGVENVLDREYVTHLNAFNPFSRERIPEKGRYVYLGLEYGF
jgi:iron complex outermembrane receptor protein